MFAFVRLLVLILLFFSLFLVAKRWFSVVKSVVFSFLTAFSFVFLTIVFPIENLFFTFQTPESAYDYMNYTQQSIELVVDGEKSSFIVGNGDPSTYLILPKHSNGWKINTGLYTKLVRQSVCDDAVISVYQYGNTSDYFVTILDLSGGQLEITDSADSKFYIRKEVDSTSQSILFTYYTYVPSAYSNYKILLGETQWEMGTGDRETVVLTPSPTKTTRKTEESMVSCSPRFFRCRFSVLPSSARPMRLTVQSVAVIIK